LATHAHGTRARTSEAFNSGVTVDPRAHRSNSPTVTSLAYDKLLVALEGSHEHWTSQGPISRVYFILRKLDEAARASRAPHACGSGHGDSSRVCPVLRFPRARALSLPRYHARERDPLEPRSWSQDRPDYGDLHRERASNCAQALGRTHRGHRHVQRVVTTDGSGARGSVVVIGVGLLLI